MQITTYSHKRFLNLLAKAGSKANLSANTGLAYGTIRDLERNACQVPTDKNLNKIMPFFNGKKLEQIRRNYRRK